ncbi:MAG: pirin family protein [Shewanellaceae bacterium]|nr:pirin family protein [Shewanellaceae bacterium]
MQILSPQSVQLGELPIRRILPHPTQAQVGPWIFFDHFGPVEFKPDEGVNVLPHPHIGLATVTFLFEGAIVHRDSLGNHQVIEPGAINFMVAGKGIAHSERESSRDKQRKRWVHGLQLWLALPEAQESIAPSFAHYAAADLPVHATKAARIKVLIGEAYGLHSPVTTFSPTLYLNMLLEPGARFDLPIAPELALYVIEGDVEVAGTSLTEYQLCHVTAMEPVQLKSNSQAHIICIGGEPLSKRHMAWNFVASDPARLEQAMLDWQQQQFDPVVGDDGRLDLMDSD